MCTLSWLLSPQEFHLFFNRDELLSRKPEIPPQHFHLKGQHILAPLDGDTMPSSMPSPQSSMQSPLQNPLQANTKGTWLGMSAQGLLLCLLNYYPPKSSETSSEYRSRGGLILDLLSDPETLRNSESPAEKLFPNIEDYRPFTLLCFDLYKKPSMRMYRWDAVQGLQVSSNPPPIVTSSSYRSSEVEACRRALFYQREKSSGVSLDSSLDLHWDFHRSHADSLPHSVCLHREGGPNPGKTVSFCHVAQIEKCFELDYFPGSPCELPPHKLLTRNETAVGQREYLPFD